MGQSRTHIVQLCLAPELRIALIKLQAEKEISEPYAILWLLSKALYQEKKLEREHYERFAQRYSSKLVQEPEPPKLTYSQLEEHQKLEEKRRWFALVKADLHKDHRPVAGKPWIDDVISEAAKYKDSLPEAAEVWKLASRYKSVFVHSSASHL